MEQVPDFGTGGSEEVTRGHGLGPFMRFVKTCNEEP